MRTTRSAVIQLLLRATSESSDNLRLLRQLDELYMEYPFFGIRRMAVTLAVNRKRSSVSWAFLASRRCIPNPISADQRLDTNGNQCLNACVSPGDKCKPCAKCLQRRFAATSYLCRQTVKVNFKNQARPDLTMEFALR
jgi:hypothetical protein